MNQYPQAISVFTFAFVVGTLATVLLFRMAQRFQLLPIIRKRDVHTTRKPRIGGVAIWFSVIVTFIWLLLRNDGLLHFGHTTQGGFDDAVPGILGGMVILLAMGLIDDIKGLNWKWQLTGQLAAALALVWSGVTVPFINLPFDHRYVLPAGGPELFTVIWVMTMINVMNWFDGLDGLAGSIALTASVVLFLVSVQLGFVGTATMALIVAGASAAFLIWNWYPSKLFMGTVGSQVLGFLLAVMAIISGGKLATLGLVLGIPVMDAIIVVFRRLRAGQSPFIADQRHLHHRLLKIGIPVPWVVILINAVAVTFGLLALYNPQSNTKGFLLLVLGMLMALFIVTTYVLERRVQKRVN